MGFVNKLLSLHTEIFGAINIWRINQIESHAVVDSLWLSIGQKNRFTRKIELVFTI